MLGKSHGGKVAASWASEIIEFWFSHGWDDWWKASDALDEEIRERFGILWARMGRRPIDEYTGDAQTALAAVILFDQFPRNMFRGQADQFATDHMALEIAKAAIERGFDDGLSQYQRLFLYMPFQHSEALKDQIQSLLLFTALGEPEALRHARMHHDVIERFGRFPHRNAVLGRKPTAMELAAGDVVPWSR
jgi:uncharacterized protein (DUF924 family)